MKKNDFVNMSINNNLKLMIENIKKRRTQGACFLCPYPFADLRASVLGL